jgi:hypothetical protein
MSFDCRIALLSRVQMGWVRFVINANATRRFGAGWAASLMRAFSSQVDTGSRNENASKEAVIGLSWESVRCAHGK